MARLRAARTVHGRYSAETRALNRHDLTALRRGRVGHAARRCFDRLPLDLASRLMQMPPELQPPPWPSGGLTPAQDRAVLRAEADALAPWRAAIAQAGLAGSASSAGPALVVGRSGASAEARAPVRLRGDPVAAQDAAGSAHPDGAAEAHAPEFAGGAGNSILAASTAAPAATQPEARAPEPAAAPAASPAAPVAAPARAHAPERAADGRGMSPAAAAASHGTPKQQPARAHAPERAADRGGAAPAAAAATHTAPTRQPAKAHAPERGPAASDASPAVLPNRAARRRWESLQRRMRPAHAACVRP
jgi:hypothetical protein